METIFGFPSAELEFGKRGEVVERKSFDELIDSLGQDGALPDVLVFVHGWNNHMKEARGWYGELAEHFRTVLASSPPSGLGKRRFRLLGVLWPSKRFAERSLIPGGAASVAGGPVADAELTGRLDELRSFFDAPDAEQRIEQAKELVPRLEDSPAAQDEFVELLRALIPKEAHADGDDFAAGFRSSAGRDVLDALKAPVMQGGPGGGGAAGGGAAAGGAAGLDGDAAGSAAFGLSLAGIKAAAERYLNLTTYYQMKERAGVVGAAGLNPCLRELRDRRKDVRIHLVGHSFGGRLVTATTVGLAGHAALAPNTVTLLQAAFSHYGFAHHYEGDRDGYFRRLVTEGMVQGPVLVTHSKRDTAVGYAYPLASRLAHQVAAGLGDAKDRYGGIGRNGAQKTPEARSGKLREAGHSYDFAGALVHNLNADAVIRDHSDIRRAEVAYAVLAAIAQA